MGDISSSNVQDPIICGKESHHFQHNVHVWLDRVSGGVAAERPTGAQRDLLHTDLYCTESPSVIPLSCARGLFGRPLRQGVSSGEMLPLVTRLVQPRWKG